MSLMISHGFDERCQRDRHAENLGEGSRGGEYPADRSCIAALHGFEEKLQNKKKLPIYIYIQTAIGFQQTPNALP